MKKYQLFLLLLVTSVLFISCHSGPREKTIGIIVPLENKALTEIVAGFIETLQKSSPTPLRFKVANAQGDMNMQRVIIEQMRDEKDEIIVPIGSVATQMTIASVHQQPIIGLATSYSEADRKQNKSCHIAIVHDEIPPEKTLTFLHRVYPQISQLTLVHSASEKILPEVKPTVALGKTMGITIKPMMASTLNDLYSVANAIPQTTQAIFILKDILIASGITTLEQIANKRHIPLITEDQGSVQEGAAFALGVHERNIGAEGATLAVAILTGQSACHLPIVEMSHLTVFVNKAALAKEKQSLAPIESAANEAHYALEFVNPSQGET